MTQDVSLALDARSHLGEGPRWHSEEKRLYWVDIGRNELHSFDPVTGHDESRAFATPIGCFSFMPDTGRLLSMKDGVASPARYDTAPDPFGGPMFAQPPALRLNYGRTVTRCRLWAGRGTIPNTAKDASSDRLDNDC